MKMTINVVDDVDVDETYPVLETVPLGGRVIKHLAGHRHHDLAQEVVAAEHVRVPDRDPHGPSLHLPAGHHELKDGVFNELTHTSNCSNDKRKWNNSVPTCHRNTIKITLCFNITLQNNALVGCGFYLEFFISL